MIPSSTNCTKKLTDKQQEILKVKQEHPDLNTREIGAVVKADHSTVVRTLQRYGINRASVEDYKAHRGDVLAGFQELILSTCTLDDIKKAPIGSRLLALCQLYDKERMERGLSVVNIASIHADIASLQDSTSSQGRGGTGQE